MKKIMALIILMFSANVFSGETKEARVDFTCHLHKKYGRRLQPLDRESRMGSLFLKESEDVGEIFEVQFVEYGNICMRLERVISGNYIILNSSVCDSKNDDDLFSGGPAFSPFKLRDGWQYFLGPAWMKSSRILRGRARVDCTFFGYIAD